MNVAERETESEIKTKREMEGEGQERREKSQWAESGWRGEERHVQYDLILHQSFAEGDKGDRQETENRGRTEGFLSCFFYSYNIDLLRDTERL